ncbi:MAG: HAMP domain-containing sensor histidine kinase [Mobilicoccus sp.]|nr:HAMP domain-containing sensor histidine kinase [Mobilicoccus sp.]
MPLWQSLRTRIAAAIAVIALGVSFAAGVVVDHQAAIDARERLRERALERLESGVTFYESQGRGRFGAVMNDPEIPPEVATAGGPGQRTTYFDGDTMIAAQHLSEHELLSVRLPADDLRTQRAELRWAFGRAALVSVAVATLLGWLLATWLSRRLRAGAQAATRIAAGETDVIASQPGRDEVALLTAALDRMARALQHRLDLERQFTADVAHELRSPVTGLVSAAELLPDDEIGHLVRGQTTRLRRLVEDLLEISRLDAVSIEIDWEECELGDVVRSALDLYADRIDIDTAAAGTAYAEPRRIERIVTNLARNALTYGAAPVRVEVVGAVVTVTDAGSGYPDELLDAGPRRFATFTSGNKGSGLGLTIATKHIEAMDGHLALCNAQPPATGARAVATFRSVPTTVEGRPSARR